MMTIHADVLFEDDTAHLLLLPEELVQKPSEMMGAKRVVCKGVIRKMVTGSKTTLLGLRGVRQSGRNGSLFLGRSRQQGFPHATL
jgi:hypothetical protein